MDDENKYRWTFRQTVGRGYIGKPIYHEYSFATIRELLAVMFFFKKEMFKRAWLRGWAKRWEV